MKVQDFQLHAFKNQNTTINAMFQQETRTHHKPHQKRTCLSIISASTDNVRTCSYQVCFTVQFSNLSQYTVDVVEQYLLLAAQIVHVVDHYELDRARRRDARWRDCRGHVCQTKLRHNNVGLRNGSYFYKETGVAWASISHMSWRPIPTNIPLPN